MSVGAHNPKKPYHHHLFSLERQKGSGVQALECSEQASECSELPALQWGYKTNVFLIYGRVSVHTHIYIYVYVCVCV